MSNEAVNGISTLKTVVGEMIKTGEGTKTVKEIISMLDAIISNIGSHKSKHSKIVKDDNEEDEVEDPLQKKRKKKILFD